MTSLMPRPIGQFPDLLRWLEPTWPFGDQHPVHIEEFADEDKYVVRAELPGLDPKHDIDVTVDGQQLTITAEREQKKHEHGRSEFRYGSFVRSVTMPAAAEPQKVKAEYENGILEITVPLRKTKDAQRVTITSPKSG